MECLLQKRILLSDVQKKSTLNIYENPTIRKTLIRKNTNHKTSDY